MFRKINYESSEVNLLINNLKKYIDDFKTYINNLKYVDEVYFIEDNNIVLKIEKKWTVRIYDNKNKLFLEVDNLSLFNRLFNNWKKTYITIDYFENYPLDFNNKSYLVYDIETIWDKFFLGYVFFNWKYRYIDHNNLSKFVEFILDFDWYVIWFNHIHFDNNIILKELNLDDKINILNKKSLDIFLFIWNLTWKRVSLDNLSKFFLWENKIFKSWSEVVKYIIKYQETKDQKLLDIVKDYCKQDVKLTLWIFNYIINNNRILIDDKEYKYNIEDFIYLSNKKRDNTNSKFMLWI